MYSLAVQATLVGPVDLEGHLYPGKKAETLWVRQAPQMLPSDEDLSNVEFDKRQL